jgi:micrococcal nuclease
MRMALGAWVSLSLVAVIFVVTIASAAPVRAQFTLCTDAGRTTCVVDGDTFWLAGEKIRIADIDTPEVSQPRCAAERQLGVRATNRLRVLLNAGPFELRTLPGRDEDRYGRKLRVVRRDGRSLGDQLVSEGLARTWSGRREPWC